MTIPIYGERWHVDAARWNEMVVQRLAPAFAAARRLVAPEAKAKYVRTEQATGVPWYAIAVIHERESSQDWQTNLSQGDRWDRVSTHVPKGRGPFASWEAAAEDALRLAKLDEVQDWRLEKILYHLEGYNGWGYAERGIASPYIWAGTNQYSRGKFNSDGHWSASTVDKQLGCAAMLKQMASLDPTITFVRES